MGKHSGNQPATKVPRKSVRQVDPAPPTTQELGAPIDPLEGAAFGTVQGWSAAKIARFTGMSASHIYQLRRKPQFMLRVAELRRESRDALKDSIIRSCKNVGRKNLEWLAENAEDEKIRCQASEALYGGGIKVISTPDIFTENEVLAERLVELSGNLSPRDIDTASLITMTREKIEFGHAHTKHPRGERAVVPGGTELDAEAPRPTLDTRFRRELGNEGDGGADTGKHPSAAGEELLPADPDDV